MSVHNGKQLEILAEEEHDVAYQPSTTITHSIAHEASGY